MDLSISFLGSDELTIADEIQTVEDNTYELGIHEQIETSYLQSVPNEFQEKFTSLSSYPQCDHQSNASDSNMSDHANLSNSVDQVNSQLSQKTQFTDPNEEEEEGECTQNSFFPTQSSERTNGSPASQFGEPLQTQQRASPLINHNYMSDHSHQQLQREQSQPTQKKIEILEGGIIIAVPKCTTTVLRAGAKRVAAVRAQPTPSPPPRIVKRTRLGMGRPRKELALSIRTFRIIT